MRRCLMIGAGGMADSWLNRFFPPFRGRMRVEALVDIDANVLHRAADALEIPPSHRFTDMESAFERVDVEFTTVVVPPGFHEEAVMRSVNRGLPILSEKPIAHTWEACERIYRAVTGAGLPMQVVQNYRFMPRILTLKQALADGAIGRPYTIHARFSADYRRRGAWGALFRHQMPHALLVEGGVHHFDQLRNLAGSDCAAISGWEWNPSHPSFDGECLGLYVARMENETRASYEGSCLGAGAQNSWHRESYRIEGEAGALSVDRDDVVRLTRHGAGEGTRVDELPAVRREHEGHEAMIEQFLDWLDGGPEPPTCLADNIRSTGMLFGAIEASQTGNPADVSARVRRLTG